MEWDLPFFDKKKSWYLKKAKLEEDLRILSNPSRGWYQIYTFPLEKTIIPEEVALNLDAQEQLAFAMVDIGAFRDRDLDALALDNLRRILEVFRRHRREVILRITYDTVGMGIEHEPSAFGQVWRHLTQLLDVLEPFSSVIFVFQGIILGSWGEMHASRHMSKENVIAILNLLEDKLNPEIFMAVRKPSFYRMLRCESEWHKKPETKIGLFNDGIFGSESDLGTYGIQTKDIVGWEQPWTAEEERRFQSVLCELVPQGGEAVMPSTPVLSLDQTVARLRQMHISYMNGHHDSKLHKVWKSQTWDHLDNWHGMNGMDYIGAHLGYRFRVLDVSYKYSILLGTYCVSVLVDNSGFAPCYFPIKLTLIQRNSDGTVQEYLSEDDISSLRSGKNMWVTYLVQRVECRYYLKLTRCRDGRVLQFGTKNTELPLEDQMCDELYLGEVCQGER